MDTMEHPPPGTLGDMRAAWLPHVGQAEETDVGGVGTGQRGRQRPKLLGAQTQDSVEQRG